MIGTGIAKTLLSGAVGVIGAGQQALRHAIWWVSYQVQGTTREDGEDR